MSMIVKKMEVEGMMLEVVKKEGLTQKKNVPTQRRNVLTQRRKVQTQRKKGSEPKEECSDLGRCVLAMF